jgi:hypothetical protein
MELREAARSRPTLQGWDPRRVLLGGLEVLLLQRVWQLLASGREHTSTTANIPENLRTLGTLILRGKLRLDRL